MSELKPCPFYGRAPTGPIRQGNGYWRIFCCGFYIERPADDLVTTAWQTRTPDPRLAEAREALEAAQILRRIPAPPSPMLWKAMCDAIRKIDAALAKMGEG